MKPLTGWMRTVWPMLLGAGLTCRLLADTGAPVILDADWAADDARAAVMILADPQWEVVAVVATDGASPPGAGATNASRILRAFGETHVPVGMGRVRLHPPPPFRQNALELGWDEVGPPWVPDGGFPEAGELVVRVLQNSDQPVVYVCLGPLTTLAEVVQTTPELRSRIQTVLWFGSPAGAELPDWNARSDESAVQVLERAGLRVETVGYPPGLAAPIVEPAWVEKLRAAGGVPARIVAGLLSHGHGAELIKQRHLRFWDDLAALRLLQPTRFRSEPIASRPTWSRVVPEPTLSVPEAVLGLMIEAPLRQTVLLTRFPADPAWLQDDVRPQARALMDRHGLEEWKAVVLTSELHRHLGTYSIVGAKMGLRARELLRAGLEEMKVQSHAGLRPPLSCLNDGLQVSTGASLGRGTITVVETSTPACEAVFFRGQQRLRLRLQKAWADRIAHELSELVQQHGGLTPSYFAAVRRAALTHWLELDRRTAFEEIWESLPAPPPNQP